MSTPYAVKLALHRRDNTLHIVNNEILDLLQIDVTAIEDYRSKTDPVCVKTLKLWFPNINNIEIIFNWLDTNRDFIYTIYGLNLLQKRYLQQNEPLQYGLLRIAKFFSGDNIELWRIMYDLWSCGMIFMENIPDSIESCDYFNIDEKHRLLINVGAYNHDMTINKDNKNHSIKADVVKLVESTDVSSSTEVTRDNNYLSTNLNAVSPLNNKNPQMPLYITIHNDAIFEVIRLRFRTRYTSDNIFVGLMIWNYFIKCVQDNKPWYLFSSSTKVNDKTLSDYTNDRYAENYEQWVEAKLYTLKISSRMVMDEIISCMPFSCSPYIIWADYINHYDNQRHLGIRKTLSLYSNDIQNSTNNDNNNNNNNNTCIQMSCNMAMYKDFPDVIERARIFMFDKYGIDHRYDDFELPELAKYSYIIGYISTIGLNKFMGDYQRKREIGLNLLGVYDMALIANQDHIKVCRIVSEALYKGAVQSSCDYYSKYGVLCENYDGSEFSKGRPQWALRDNKTITNWSLLVETMKYGMANSMLTSQTTTLTSCLLTGVTQSVTLAIIDGVISNERVNGRCKYIGYGVMYRSMNKYYLINIPDDIDSQLDMYVASLDFIDHNQSTIFTVNLDKQQLLDLTMKTFEAKLKTGIFLMIFKTQINNLQGTITG